MIDRSHMERGGLEIEPTAHMGVHASADAAAAVSRLSRSRLDSEGGAAPTPN